MDGSRPASPRGARRQAPVPPRTGSPDSVVRGHHARGSSSSPAGGLHHDAAVSELCSNVETFQQGFNSKDFLAGLSEKLIARSKADPGPFNPRPFIRTFESSVDALLALRGQLTSQMTVLSSSVRVSESAYTSKLHDLSSHFASASSSFSSLENRFSEVGRTAIHIGEQLQTIDRMRTRAAEAHDLIEYYYQFARGDTSRLERLRKEGGREGRLRTAVITRRLGAIAREVDIPGADATRETIDKFAERFERDMLKLFDRFYRKSDPKMMSHIAKVLQSFNGGHSCVQIYVNQHDFFISKDRVGQRRELEQSAMWASIADPDALPPKSEPSLQALFDEIRSTVEVEAQIISAVFPNPLVVMSTFLHRVFAQSVQGYVEVLMDRASEVGGGSLVSATPTTANNGGATTSSEGHLAFLRTLQMARSMSLSLVNDLKVYDFRGAGIVTKSRNGIAGELFGADGSMVAAGGADSAALANGTAAGGGGGPSLGIMLDQAVEELFVPYMEGVKYAERESRSLTELYAAYLYRFTQFHRPAANQTKSTNIFDRVRTQITTSTGGAASAGSNAASAGAAQVTGGSGGAVGGATSATGAASRSGAFGGFSKLTNLVDRARVAAGGTALSTASTTSLGGTGGGGSTEGSTLVDARLDDALTDALEERDGELSLDVAERLLRWHAEAIGRCVDLSTPSDVAKNTFGLLKVLTDGYVKAYVETALDSALAHASAQEARGTTMPDLRDLHVVRQAELTMQLWQYYVNTALLPLVSSSVTVRREMGMYNNHVLLRVEQTCDAVVQKIIDNVVGFLSGRLSTQKKNDFTPKNDELAFSRINTDPCLAIVDVLEKVQQAARNGLGAGKNCEAFLTEIGVAFHGLLLDHFRRFTISAAGGIMLTKDLAMYQDAITTFGIAALSDRFEMLRQLGNLFIVQPAVLKSYMRESHLSKIEERLLRPYLLRRADYTTHVRDLTELASGTAAQASSGGGGATTVDSPAAAAAQSIAEGVNGVVSSAAGFHNVGGGLSDSEKVRRLTALMGELARWSKEDDCARVNDANLRRFRDEEQAAAAAAAASAAVSPTPS